MTEQFDVAVVGGGPAGSTTATLLAKKGYSVFLAEKEKFPRYHIGESTVPAMQPIFDELGITEEIEQRGFVVKRGITLVWGRDREPWSVKFSEPGGVMTSSLDHSFQVVRSEFDAMLLNAARRSGVTVLEEARVTDFLFEQERCSGLKYVLGSNGEPQTISARFVVDASGQSALLARKKGVLEWDEELKNIAVWAYYQGGKTLDGWKAGNILVENLPNGWLWVIPLHDGTQSVGLVMPARDAQGRQALEELLEDAIAHSQESKKLLASARRVSNYRTARDWSYKCTSLYGAGFLMTGDAAGFVDPLFSTGVFLALRGARLAAETIDSILKQPQNEQELLQSYGQIYQDFLDSVISLVRFFYDAFYGASKNKEEYWEKAQQLIDPVQQLTARQDFILLISGQAGIVDVMRLDQSKINV